MSFLLDTNVVSELRQPRGFNPLVIDWVKSQAAEDAFLSVITLLEIRRGILLLAPRDPVHAAKLETWLTTIVIEGFAGRILAIDAEVALVCAGLHVPRTRPYADSLIAATAMVHDLTLLTRDTKGFAGIAIKTLNPWDR